MKRSLSAGSIFFLLICVACSGSADERTDHQQAKQDSSIGKPAIQVVPDSVINASHTTEMKAARVDSSPAIQEETPKKERHLYGIGNKNPKELDSLKKAAKAKKN